MERLEDPPDAPATGALLQALVEAYAALGRWLWRGIVPGRSRRGAHADRAV